MESRVLVGAEKEPAASPRAEARLKVNRKRDEPRPPAARTLFPEIEGLVLPRFEARGY